MRSLQPLLARDMQDLGDDEGLLLRGLELAIAFERVNHHPAISRP